MPLKDLKIAEGIQLDPVQLERVKLATDVLIDVLGESAGRVSAEWELVQDAQARPLLHLVVEDPWWQSMLDFVPDEFESKRQLWWRLHRMWGDHLQMTSRRQLKELHEAVQELGNE